MNIVDIRVWGLPPSEIECESDSTVYHHTFLIVALE